MLQALVIGAGPTGLTMAAELARHGVHPRIVDALAVPGEQSRALGVHARTLEAWSTMGIVDRALALGWRVHGINVYADGKRIVHVLTDEIDSPYPFVLSLPQSETERMLAEHAATLDVRVERSTKLVALAQDDAGVTATLAKDGGADESVRASYVIGCDGAHSAVRKAIGVPFVGSAYEEAFALADLTINWELPSDEMHSFLSPDGVIAAIPLPGARRYRLVMDLPASFQGEPTLDMFASAMRARCTTETTLRDPGWMTSFRIHRRIAPEYRKGRAFLAGDAAHIHSPVGGQGMNTGIQDAVNLAWKLALVLRGRAKESILDSYAVERRPIAAATVQGTDLATRVVTLRNPVARELRNRLGALLSTVEAIQHRITRQASEIGLAYRKSPIVGEDRIAAFATNIVEDRTSESPSVRDWLDFGAAPGPGDRAPDCTIDDERGTRVFELLRHSKHTLFLFDGAAATAQGYRTLASIARAVRAKYEDLVAVHVVVPSTERPPALDAEIPVLLDPQATMHARYGAAAECLYLVRPDGYVAFRAQPAREEKLFAYLERLFIEPAR
jgi:2-polyprenyl-6-methoxyphenol hydroxylase-like FAD-dependent oxidoreductase